MKFDPKIHHRRSIRLKGYDYRQAGGYFVTLVTQGREMLFGEIVNGETELNDFGKIVAETWLWLETQYPYVALGEWVVMPNHFHGVIFIEEPVGGDLRVAPGIGITPLIPQANPPANLIPGDGIFPRNGGEHAGSPLQRPNAPLSQMIQWFKTMTTNEYIRAVKQLGWKPFNGKLWQRNYYEHIIRSEPELDRITRYIESNPARWTDDNQNPSRK
jgi:REP element-mobilizing transposase RayT